MRSRKLNITPRVIVTHVESLIFFYQLSSKFTKRFAKEQLYTNLTHLERRLSWKT